MSCIPRTEQAYLILKLAAPQRLTVQDIMQYFENIGVNIGPSEDPRRTSTALSVALRALFQKGHIKTDRQPGHTRQRQYWWDPDCIPLPSKEFPLWYRLVYACDAEQRTRVTTGWAQKKLGSKGNAACIQAEKKGYLEREGWGVYRRTDKEVEGL